jgi:hypothetical protein
MRTSRALVLKSAPHHLPSWNHSLLCGVVPLGQLPEPT